jgi:predicted ribosome quality control (RQC) complex YloA/Tae2 family protein
VSSPAAPRERGLSARELALAAEELGALLRGAVVIDVAKILETDDLLLVLEQHARKIFLHIALGQDRARIAPTARRFSRDEFQRGPQSDALLQRLRTARVTAVVHAAGERRVEFEFAAADQPLRLCVELFSARGLWALCARDGTTLELSRPVTTAVRTLQTGSRYVPPPARNDVADDAPSRFGQPVLASIDAHFLPADKKRAREHLCTSLRLSCDRFAARTRKKVEGLREQLAQTDRAGKLREEADLLLAYLHAIPRGAESVEVDDPMGDGTRTIELDPALPARAQAEARYDKARRLEEGRAISEQRLAAAEQELAKLERIAASIEAISPDDEPALRECEAALHKLGAIAKPKQEPTAKPGAAKKKDKVHGENVRRYTSVEGYEILVGRDNQQNDRLTLRIAKGNDLWLHVGGGRPGSHVVIRLPKGKTASLDTLLDAGTLAVHFSKARGERTIDVIYTLAKNVRKPKGLPAGAVVPSQTKTITVRLDEERLKRLLSGSDDDS